MAPRTRIFKNCVIAHTDGLPVEKRDKLKGWIEHAGGKVSKEITDSVTHLILSRSDWRRLSDKVRQARRKRTIYLVRLSWLEDSLLLNQSKSQPLDECNKKYTWELSHARKVIEKRRAKALEVKKEAARARALAARLDVDHSETEHGRKDTVQGVSSALPGRNLDDIGIEPPEKRKAMEKMNQISECGIKFDKSVLETERNMVLAGYRPYVDPTGFVYMVNLIRNDVRKVIQEEYKLKSTPDSVESFRQIRPEVGVKDTVSCNAITRRRRRGRKTKKGGFNMGLDTQLRHLEQSNTSLRQMCISKRQYELGGFSNNCSDQIMLDGVQSHGFAISHEPWNAVSQQQQPETSEFQYWEQHLPFSLLPIMPYTPLSHINPDIRVHLPQPFAYSLQLYESFDQASIIRQNNQNTATPSLSTELSSLESSSAEFHSFTDSLPQPTQPIRSLSSGSSTSAEHITSNAVASAALHDVQTYSSKEKSYMVICQYTKKGKQRACETTTLAPEGSNFGFAMDTFRKLFKKKTAMSWEDAQGRQMTNGSNINLSSDRPSQCESTHVDFHSLPPYTTSTGPREIDRDSVLSDDTSRTIAPDGYDYSTRRNSAALDGLISPSADQCTPPVGLNHPQAVQTSAPLHTATQSVPSPINVPENDEFQKFTYVPTKRGTFENGNKKYKARYGEDLFTFPALVAKALKAEEAGSGAIKNSTAAETA